MSFIRSTAKVVVAIVTVPVGVAVGATGGAVAGLALGGIGGGVLGWNAAGAIVGENRVKPPKTAAQVQAEAIYAFMPASIKVAVADGLAKEMMKAAEAESKRQAVASAAAAPSV